MSRYETKGKVSVRDQGGACSYEISIAALPAEGLARLGELAEAWGARWRPEGTEGGRLTLPVRAGVRRGMVAGRISVQVASGGSRLRFDVEEAFYRVQYAAFFFLLLGAFGGLTILVAPFNPTLLPLVPVGVMLAIASWFLIVSRLTNSGPEEFLGELAANEPQDPRETEGGE